MSRTPSAASMNHPRPRQPSRSSGMAIGLSLLWPGLGHWYLGRTRPALVLGIPAALVALPLFVVAAGGFDHLAAALIVPRNAFALVLGLLLTTVWRVVALTDSYRLAPRSTSSSLGRVTAVLAIAIVVAGLFAVAAAWSLYGATSRVFQSDDRGDTANTSFQPQATSDIGVLPQPHETPVDPGSRINILLVGSDSGLGYQHSLTDTIMVVSVDPVARSVAMISIPRDIARFPLYGGGVYSGKINSLASTAAANPDQYADGGLGTLSRAVGYLIGVDIHYVAYVNLAGFRDLVDSVGGVDVAVEHPIDDPGYQFPDGKVGFQISAGRHHLNGRTALAFVRSRNGAGENDFTRARRQQLLLIALRDQLISPAMLPKLPAVLDAIAGVVATNFPPERVGEMLDLAKAADGDKIERFVLGPPYATRPSNGGGEYILVPNLDVIAKWSAKLFGVASRYDTGG